ncbi:hypothetical protein BLNAU_25244 [Blattamonas nauphoetae]|uniref:Protein kinase domain-containing protein n=1 Tax=Blattamonas nauphoetae TaxID=2049346 RepID=A0ABQ9WK55_9EUKA|nr:hypothetical protein BLNAU_25244 [Blattamonas nauphoetae]
MKVLPFTSEADFNKNEHEISKLQKNQHKNVVGFVEAIEGDTAHFVVLELCSCSLADRMSEGQKLGTLMDRVKVFRIVQDVLAGLGFLHSRNEVDFEEWLESGLKRRGMRRSVDDAVLGPEMFVLGGNVGSVSQAGDMWAFGLIVLELLTGKAWISGQNAVEIAESVKGFDVQAVCRPATIANTAEPLLSTPFDFGRKHHSRFIREELDSTERTVEQLLERLSERDNTIAQLEREKAQMQQIIEQQATTIAQQRVHDTVGCRVYRHFRFKRKLSWLWLCQICERRISTKGNGAEETEAAEGGDKMEELACEQLALEMTDEEFRTFEDGTSRGFGFCLFEKTKMHVNAFSSPVKQKFRVDVFRLTLFRAIANELPEPNLQWELESMARECRYQVCPVWVRWGCLIAADADELHASDGMGQMGMGMPIGAAI